MAEVQQTQVLPAPFIEAPAKAYLGELETAIGGIKDLDVSQLYGSQFVAGPGALQTQAEGLAGGLGNYAPFLQGAAGAQTAAQNLTGPTAYQSYMSPYQQDIIDTTLTEYDRQAQMQMPAMAANAIGAGAFGGGREGVQRAEYQSSSDRNRAALQAQLLGQGFTQAQGLAQNAFNQQQTLGVGQSNLAQLAPQLLGNQIGALSTLGAQQQAQSQAQLGANQQLAYQQAYQPLQAAQQYGSGVMGLISGYPQRESTSPLPPSASPLSTALGVGSTLAGIYRAITPQSININRN
jgi:hypothetical protein